MAALPEPWKSLSARIYKIEETLRGLANRSPFFGTGMHTNGEGGIDSDNFVAGASGYSFGQDGNAEFNDLTLRGGIIGNASLTSPVAPARLHADAQSFAVTTSYATVMTVAISVPEGYTQALILNLTTATTAYNSTAGVDFLYCRTRINDASAGGGWVLGSADVAAGGTGVALDFRTTLLSGLTAGDSLTFTGQVKSAFGGWAANSSNLANVDVALLWIR